MRDHTVYCQEGKRIDATGVKLRVVLCEKVAKVYSVPGSLHSVSLCSEHIRKYPNAVEIE